MRRYRGRLTALCIAALATTLPAQLPVTRLRTVFPPSGQAGTTFDLQLVAGDDLEEITTLRFSLAGITSTPKMHDVEGRPAPVDKQFAVSIAADVPPGIYEVRAVGLWGASNPVRFAVTGRQQFVENDDNATPQTAQPAALNTSVVGRMDGTSDVDCFRFAATQGQRVVLDCLARRLDSPLQAELVLHDSGGRRLAAGSLGEEGDPRLVFDVPADGDYVVELHDVTYRNGPEYVYRLDLHTGPLIAFVTPPAGPAGTRSQFTLWGYNLPGSTPTVSSVPLVSAAGLPSPSLETLDVDIDVPRVDAALPMQNVVPPYAVNVAAFSWRFDSPSGQSHPVRIGISDRPAVREVEPNDDPAQALAVTAPAEVAGQLAQPGDRDWIAFAGQPGQVYWIEAIGQRTGSTLDPVLVVDEVTRDANGAEQIKRLTQQDDEGTNVAQNVFDTFTDDPVYRLAVGQAATYRVAVYDRYGQTRGDPALRYRLCIRDEDPDFSVVAVPALKQNNTGTVTPLVLRKGDSQAVDLYALRRFGFDGPIDVSVEGLPAGVTCAGTTIGSKESAGVIVFRAAEDAGETTADVRMIARAVCERPAARRARNDAAKQLADAEQPLVKQRQAREAADAQLRSAVQERDAAARRSGDDPANQNLARELEQRQQAVTTMQSQYAAATDAVAAAEQSLTVVRTALDKAEAELATGTRHLRHVVRSGTLISGGQNNVAAEGRLAQSFAVSVLKESAPFELRAELPPRLVASQSQQILMPVQLIKRNGFDEKVQLTPAGLPKGSNLQVPGVAIEKGRSDAIVSIFVKENTPPGTYALWINAQGQVSYSRNPERTARLAAERDQSAARLKSAQEAAATAAAAKNQAVQAADAAQSALLAARQSQQQAEQAVAQRTQEAAQAKPLRDAAESNAAATSLAVTTAAAALASARETLAVDSENANLKSDVAQAETVLSTLQRAANEAAAAREAASKALADAERLLTESVAAQRSAVAATLAAEQAKQQADAARTAAEGAEKSAQEAVQPAEMRKQTDDKRVAEAGKLSQPQNKNFTPSIGPVVFEVVPAPLKLSVTVPGGGAVQRGKSLDLHVKLERLDRFSGPVRIGVLSPPGLTGVAGEVTVPSEATEAQLTMTAAADATEGQLPHVVLRASVEHQGRPLGVDAPLSIKVTP